MSPPRARSSAGLRRLQSFFVRLLSTKRGGIPAPRKGPRGRPAVDVDGTEQLGQIDELIVDARHCRLA